MTTDLGLEPGGKSYASIIFDLCDPIELPDTSFYLLIFFKTTLHDELVPDLFL